MENKFNFTPKQWVLVRDCKGGKWALARFSHYDKDSKSWPYRMLGDTGFAYCIPYEGNESLLGTTDDYIEPWKPKGGDFIYVSTHISPRGYIFISKGNYKLTAYRVAYDVEDHILHTDGSCCDNNDIEELRPATEEEKQQLLDALHETGKDWDAKKKEIVEYICMKRGQKYFYFDFSGTIRETTWADLPTEREMYKNGFISFTHKDAADKYRKVTELLKGDLKS